MASELLSQIKAKGFHVRNEYPEIIDSLFNTLPKEGQRVQVHYTYDTNEYVWYQGGKFVNKYGFEMEGVMGWKPFLQDIIATT